MGGIVSGEDDGLSRSGVNTITEDVIKAEVEKHLLKEATSTSVPIAYVSSLSLLAQEQPSSNVEICSHSLLIIHRFLFLAGSSSCDGQ